MPLCPRRLDACRIGKIVALLCYTQTRTKHVRTQRKFAQNRTSIRYVAQSLSMDVLSKTATPAKNTRAERAYCFFLSHLNIVDLLRLLVLSLQSYSATKVICGIFAVCVRGRVRIFVFRSAFIFAISLCSSSFPLRNVVSVSETRAMQAHTKKQQHLARR